MTRTGVNSIMVLINSIPELEDLEQNKLNWNWKILIGIEWKGIVHDNLWCCEGYFTQSIAVQAMVFNDQEKLGNEAAGQTLPSN